MSLTLIARRGSSRSPEAITRAIDTALDSGVDNIELDLRLADDGSAIVRTDVPVDPDDYDVEPQEPGQLLLREVLERYSARAHLHLELASDDPALAPAVAEDLLAAGMQPGAGAFDAPGYTLTSFHCEQLSAAARLLSWAPEQHLLVSQFAHSWIETAQEEGYTGLVLPAGALTAVQVQIVRNSGLGVRVHGVRDPQDLVRAARAGADAAAVDWPSVARGVLSSI